MKTQEYFSKSKNNFQVTFPVHYILRISQFLNGVIEIEYICKSIIDTTFCTLNSASFAVLISEETFLKNVLCFAGTFSLY